MSLKALAASFLSVLLPARRVWHLQSFAWFLRRRLRSSRAAFALTCVSDWKERFLEVVDRLRRRRFAPSRTTVGSADGQKLFRPRGFHLGHPCVVEVRKEMHSNSFFVVIVRPALHLRVGHDPMHGELSKSPQLRIACNASIGGDWAPRASAVKLSWRTAGVIDERREGPDQRRHAAVAGYRRLGFHRLHGLDGDAECASRCSGSLGQFASPFLRSDSARRAALRAGCAQGTSANRDRPKLVSRMTGRPSIWST